MRETFWQEVLGGLIGGGEAFEAGRGIVRKIWVVVVLIVCLASGCGEGGEKVLRDLIDLNEAIGVILDDVRKIDAILDGRDVDDRQHAAELHVAEVEAAYLDLDDMAIAFEPDIAAALPAPDLFEDEPAANYCCTPDDGACPMGIGGVSVDEPCECILGDRSFFGSTCSTP